MDYTSLPATCFHVGFLLGLFFDHEDGGDMFRTTRRYIPEDGTLHNHRFENLKSYITDLICKIVNRVDKTNRYYKAI
jgi:hypothetical protein